MNKTVVVTIVFVALLLAIPFRAAAQNSSATQEPIQAGHTHDVIEVKWSPDDERLISYSGGDGYIRLWEVKSARLLWGARTSFIQQKDEYYTLTNFAWSPDQALIASGSGNGMIQIWDAQTGKLRWNVRAHDEDVNALVFSPDGKYLVSSGLGEDEKNEIKTWSVVNGSQIRKFNADPGVVIAISVNRDGTRLKAGNLGGEISEWNSGAGALMRKRKMNPCGGAGSRARRVAFNPDLSLMSARCGEQTVVTDTTSGKVVRWIKMKADFTKTLAFSGNSKILAATDLANIDVINLSDGEMREVDEFVMGHTIGLNHNGALLAEGGGWRDAAVKITEVATGKTYRMLEGHPGIINTLAFSPDGSSLASGGSDRVIRFWDPRSGSISASFYGHQRSINALAFNPQGNLLVSNGQDREMKVWDVNSGALLRTIDVSSVAINPDGKTIAAAESGGEISLWEIQSGKLLIRLAPGYSDDDVVAFSPDGKTFAAGGLNQNIMLWEMKSGHLQWSLLPLPSKEEIEAGEEKAKQLAILDAERERRIQQADAEAATWDGKIRISFESYGEPIDLMSARLAEPARPYRKPKKQSAQTASGVWLRLRNDSHLPITFSTVSLYLNRGAKCGYKTSGGKFFEGLCDGTEVNIRYGIEDASGEPIPWGFDFGAISMLPPGASVVFSVRRDHLENGRAILILYRYQKEGEKGRLEDYGSERWVYFKSSDLPR
jgi:WD40 repeat protein